MRIFFRPFFGGCGAFAGSIGPSFDAVAICEGIWLKQAHRPHYDSAWSKAPLSQLRLN